MTSLAQLAADSGGRFTEATNDLSLGYARAQRDLGCVYTVGLYVDEEEEDRIRSLKVRINRPGVRAVHPSKYLFRSPERQKSSLLRAAWAAPEMFQTGIVRAHVFPLRPSSPSKWSALLAVSFPVPLRGIEDASALRDFGAVLYDGAVMVHRFNRRITLKPNRPGVVSEPLVTFLEPVDVKPGSYTLTAVLTDPGSSDPHAAKVIVEVPEVTRRELFLVGPVLGRPSGSNLVVTGGGADAAQDRIGAENAFEPLLVQQAEGPIDLVALSQACLVGPKKVSRASRRIRLDRRLRDSRGQSVGDLAGVDLELESEARVHCGNLVDVLPAASVSPGRYEFQVTLDPEGKRRESSSIRFVVEAPDEL